VALHYQKRKRKGSMMDFDDLLLNWLTLLSDHPTLREYYSHKFQYILVDEYQDTNRIQSDIVDLLSQEHKNTMVVGDDSQSIYSFRGANFANIIDFPQRYPNVRIYKLETNYRSVPEILNLANASIINNQNQFQKHLRAIRGSGLQPILVPFNDVMQQASFVAQRILELRDEGRSLNEMAVLYRAHYHSMELQMELTRRGIPFEVRSGLRFFEQAHIKDITGYLKVIVNPYDELAWKRIAKLLPKIGNATAHKIWNILSSSNRPLKSMKFENTLKLIPKPSKDRWNKLTTTLNHLDAPDLLKSPAEMIRTVLNEEYEEYLRSAYPDHESRMEDINQLMYFSQQYSSTESFLSELALLSSVASEDVVGGGYEDERVKLSTIHQAKGLEWDIVFIIWLVEGRFPSMRSLNSSAGEEEERRLFYVAVTRARDELYLGYPFWDYGSYKSSTLLKPSRFIQEIPTTSYTKWMVEEEE
jgi:DNA helicase-2/ATP-dependent DNA helicase PcrA